MARFTFTIVGFYFLVRVVSCEENISDVFNNFGKDDINRHFNGSVSTINGQVFINWSTSGPWSRSKTVNTAVYFLTNYTDKKSTFHHINISLCYATKQENNSWIIRPIQRNLLEFCNKSGLCLHENITSLVNSFWVTERQLLSCQLFTTCSNFNGLFGIEISTTTDEKNYRRYFGELMIYYQNEPPSISDVRLGNLQSSSEKAVVLWDYPRSSQLCGFGTNVSKNIEFVIRYFKLNLSRHCYFMGQEAVNFNQHMAIFTNLSIINTNKYTFYLNAKSLINNKTSKYWMKQNFAKEVNDKFDGCKVYNGLLKISWQPDWDCFHFDTVHQIVFCPLDEPKVCIPICQITLSKNATSGQPIPFSNNLINFCQRHPNYCRIPSKNTSIVDATWNTSHGLLQCTMFKYCTEYKSLFKIKTRTFSKSSQGIKEEYLCDHVNILRDNEPLPPSDIKVVDIQRTTATISWRYYHCDNVMLNAKFEITLNNENVATTQVTSNVSYFHTLTNLNPFTRYSLQMFVKKTLKRSPGTNAKIFKTKEGAPKRGPFIKSNERQGNNIKLKWKLPNNLFGIPEFYIVDVYDEKNNLVWNNTLHNGNLTSITINGDHLPKCVRLNIYITICNAPQLCSPRTKTTSTAPRCQNNNSGQQFFDGSNKTWVIVLVVSFIVLLLLLCASVVWKKRRKSHSRQRLPSLTGVPLASDEYIDIGQPNEYNTLQPESY